MTVVSMDSSIVEQCCAIDLLPLIIGIRLTTSVFYKLRQPDRAGGKICVAVI